MGEIALNARYGEGMLMPPSGEQLDQMVSAELWRRQLLLEGRPKIVAFCGQLAIDRAAHYPWALQHVAVTVERDENDVEFRVIPYETKITPFDQPVELCVQRNTATAPSGMGYVILGDSFQAEVASSFEVDAEYRSDLYGKASEIAWSQADSLAYLYSRAGF